MFSSLLFLFVVGPNLGQFRSHSQFVILAFLVFLQHTYCKHKCVTSMAVRVKMPDHSRVYSYMKINKAISLRFSLEEFFITVELFKPCLVDERDCLGLITEHIPGLIACCLISCFLHLLKGIVLDIFKLQSTGEKFKHFTLQKKP